MKVISKIFSNQSMFIEKKYLLLVLMKNDDDLLHGSGSLKDDFNRLCKDFKNKL